MVKVRTSNYTSPIGGGVRRGSISGYSPSPTQYQQNPRFNTVNSKSPGATTVTQHNPSITTYNQMGSRVLTPSRVVRNSQGQIISPSPYTGTSPIKRLSVTQYQQQPRILTPTRQSTYNQSYKNGNLRGSRAVRRNESKPNLNRSRSNSQEDLWRIAMSDKSED